MENTPGPSLTDFPTELLIAICDALDCMRDPNLGLKLTTEPTQPITESTTYYVPRRPIDDRPFLFRGLSLTCKRLRAICWPYLFRHISMTLHEDEDVKAELAALLVEPEIIKCIKSVLLTRDNDISIERPLSRKHGQGAQPGSALGGINRLFKMIPQGNLTRLAIPMPFVTGHYFHAFFRERDLSFPYVKDLTISFNTDWIIPLCGSAVLGRLERLALVHPTTFRPITSISFSSFRYKSQTDGFIKNVMLLGSGNGIRELVIERTLSWSEISKLVKFTSNLQILRYGLDTMDLANINYELASRAPIAFQQIYQLIEKMFKARHDWDWKPNDTTRFKKFYEAIQNADKSELAELTSLAKNLIEVRIEGALVARVVRLQGEDSYDPAATTWVLDRL